MWISHVYVKQHLIHKENAQTYFLNIEKTFDHVVTEIKAPSES